ncbi:NAD(P)/FAD-dependent oxidoreductase [Ornithobacterium rhinotracheale]
MNIPDLSIKRVVVIGAGFAGFNLAKKLNKQNLQVVLIDKNNYHTFQPLLYQVATAGLEADSIAHAVRTLFKKEKNFHFRIAQISRIDTQNKKIHSDIGDLSYDYLVIATGSKTNYYGNKNIETYSMPMKSIPQALDLRHLVLQNFEAALLTDDLAERERLMNFVIVGGGPTGVELAGAFSELKNHVLPNDYPDLDIRRMNVHLIQAVDRLLPGFSDKASTKVAEYLRKMDVHVWLNTIVQDYDGKVAKTNLRNFETSTLIWAAGVQGSTIDGMPEESVERGRYKVDLYNKVLGVEDIYAIGDIACMQSEDYPHGHPMVAQPAIQQGKLLARNLNALSIGKEMKAFKYNDKGSMATIGRNKAVADIGKFKFTGFFAWMIWMFVHLISLVGFRNKVVALVNWVIQYFQYNKGVRLIIRPYRRKVKEISEAENIEAVLEADEKS